MTDSERLLTDERCAIELDESDCRSLLNAWRVAVETGGWRTLECILERNAEFCLYGGAHEQAYEFYFLSDIAAERAKEDVC